MASKSVIMNPIQNFTHNCHRNVLRTRGSRARVRIGGLGQPDGVIYVPGEGSHKTGGWENGGLTLSSFWGLKLPGEDVRFYIYLTWNVGNGEVKAGGKTVTTRLACGSVFLHSVSRPRFYGL